MFLILSILFGSIDINMKINSTREQYEHRESLPFSLRIEKNRWFLVIEIKRQGTST